MNWFKQNTFLAGFLGVVVVAAGVLGFLLLSAKGRHSEAATLYEEQSNELARLQSLAPYPDPANLKKMEGQRKEFQDAIAALQKNLGAAEIAVEPLSEVQFQDKLRESVSRVTAAAAAKGTKLPEKFYMGFDPYQTEPPKPEAAPLLGRQLKAMEAVVMMVIENKGFSINKLEREELPEEKGVEKKEPDKKSGGKGERSSSQPLVTKHPFDINFTGDQNLLRAVLNGLVSSKAQFYIPRRVEVRNEKDKGPPRIDPAAAAMAAAALAAAAAPPAEGVPPAAPDASTPGTPAAPAPLPGAAAPPAAALKYIVGEEKIEAAIRIEIVDFAEPAPATKK